MRVGNRVEAINIDFTINVELVYSKFLYLNSLKTCSETAWF